MLQVCVVLTLATVVRSEMEPFVVGGEYVPIFRFPHSSVLYVTCANANGNKTSWMCGASIVNQILLLTAAHCVYSCASGTTMTAKFGNRDIHSGKTRTIRSFLYHKSYDPARITSDIALARLFQPLHFSRRISRVAIMKMPPYKETAHIAGWGLINEDTNAVSSKLKEVDQYVWDLSDCEKKLGHLPEGVLCASAKKEGDYPAEGDSGSALVVRDYIQIGLVSYKTPSAAKNLIVYTDVGYYVDWIQNYAKKLYCFKS